MIGLKLPVRKRARDEAEKPFWISFSDLMTALMVLFLVSVTVALFAVTQKPPVPPVPPDPVAIQEKKIEACMIYFEKEVAKYPEVKVNVGNRSVSFGEKARFGIRNYDLSSASASQLREFAPEVLKLADSSCGRDLFRRVVVEGYTSKDGTYLYNLDLSLKRAQSVVCALLDEPKRFGETGLSDDQKRRVRNLFMVGGYSSNAPKETDEDSRRVEFKLEFWALDEKIKTAHRDDLSSNNTTTLSEQELGRCQLIRRADQ